MSAFTRRPPRYPLRIVLESPAWASSVVLPIAAGIGLGIPVLGIVRSILRRDSPHVDSLLSESGPATEWLSGWTAGRQTIPEIQNEALRTLVAVLLGLTLLLLAIALISTLTSLLARATVKRPEIALRAVLGGTRSRLIAHLLAEGLLLVLSGGMLGLAIAAAGLPALTRSWPGGDPPWSGAVLHWSVVAATLGVFVLVPLGGALASGVVAWQRDLRRFLVTGARSTGGPGEAVARQAMAVVQIAASLVLLVSAGLLLRGYAFPVEPRFETGDDHLKTLTVQIRLPGPGNLDERERWLLHQSARDRISALPGVVDTSVASVGSWVGLGTRDRVHALTGNPEQPGWVKPAHYNAVSAGFFRAHGVPVIHGREFSPADSIAAPRVVVVNQAFVNHFALLDHGMGRTVQLHGMRLDEPWYTIVGVVEDLGAEALGAGSTPIPMLYLSAAQHPPIQAGLAVRTTGDPMRLVEEIEGVFRQLSPEARVSTPMMMEEYLARFREPLRWFSFLFGILAGIALLLATLGVQGLMAYNVARRTREIGIRMAIGARQTHITGMVVRQSLHVTALGAVMGLIALGGVARLIQLLLGGVELFDPMLFGAVVLLLGGVAVFASHAPARRATAVDPQISLMAE